VQTEQVVLQLKHAPKELIFLDTSQCYKLINKSLKTKYNNVKLVGGNYHYNFEIYEMDEGRSLIKPSFTMNIYVKMV